MIWINLLLYHNLLLAFPFFLFLLLEVSQEERITVSLVSLLLIKATLSLGIKTLWWKSSTRFLLHPRNRWAPTCINPKIKPLSPLKHISYSFAMTLGNYTLPLTSFWLLPCFQLQFAITGAPEQPHFHAESPSSPSLALCNNPTPSGPCSLKGHVPPRTFWYLKLHLCLLGKTSKRCWGQGSDPSLEKQKKILTVAYEEWCKTTDCILSRRMN